MNKTTVRQVSDHVFEEKPHKISMINEQGLKVVLFCLSLIRASRFVYTEHYLMAANRSLQCHGGYHEKSNIFYLLE
jgi:hypothetical protein